MNSISVFQTDLGSRLLHGFSSSSGVPYSDINLNTLKSHPPKWSPDSSVSEVTSVQLEFRDLTQLTGDKKYQEAVDKVIEVVQVIDTCVADGIHTFVENCKDSFVDHGILIHIVVLYFAHLNYCNFHQTIIMLTAYWLYFVLHNDFIVYVISVSGKS